MDGITSLYRKHFQKSRIFLYPVLGIRRGSMVTPVETYVRWKDNFDVKDKKLICVYAVDHTNYMDDKGNKVYVPDPIRHSGFMRGSVTNNALFCGWRDLEEQLNGMDLRAYIFDFPNEMNWYRFIEGKYSKFNPEFKRRIKRFFSVAGDYATYVDSYINPWNYYGMYSEILGVSVSLLKETVELLDCPDLEEETLHAKIKHTKTITK